jgi:hypothetical protein
MRFVKTLLLGAAVILAGCQFDFPLSLEHSIPVDPDAIGLWESVPEQGEKTEGMMVLKFSDTEYLIHYPTGEEGMYFRGYPVEVGGVACVQLELLGTEDGPVAKGDKARFQIANYEIKDEVLTIKTINTELIGGELKSSEELNKVFLEHNDDPELFTNPGKFRKIQEKS